jgi:hypothetical protein
MESKLAKRFVGKKVLFKKTGSEINFIGDLIEVTGDSILLEFRGRLQSHLLESITEMQEAINDKKEEEGT